MSYTINFQSAYGTVTGECEIFEGTPSSTDTDRPPTEVIELDQPWFCHFKWETTSSEWNSVTGKWQLKLYLEKMGEGEFSLPGDDGLTEVECIAGPQLYDSLDTNIEVDANVVPAGTYKVVAAITLLGPTNLPTPFAGFSEGPYLQFFDRG